MTLSDISIKNTVFAWILMFGLIIFGAIGFSRMGISRLPDVDFPVLNIAVTWPGAAPETMESSVADVLEDSVMSIEGIRNVVSVSQEGLTNITVEFELSRQIDSALQEVQTKVFQAQRNLPVDIDPPVVTKSNPEDRPIMWIALSGTEDRRRLGLFVRDRLKNSLTTIGGVGEVRLGGYVDPNMRIWLDNDAMRRMEITVDDVIYTVASQHALTPSGYMDNGPEESNVRVLSEARTAREFDNLVIAKRSGEPVWKRIRLGEVARAEEGLADVRRISRFRGMLAQGMGVIKQRGSNAVAVGRAVRKKVAELVSGGIVPAGLRLNIVADDTRFIEESTRDLIFTLVLSVLLTSMVCWLFLGSWSSAFNVILAIPTSLVGSFIVLYFLGFTLNTFTLLALSLSIGIVVDDAIMVLENIVRHFESGMGRVKAAIVGAREITSAAAAASLAILAIFLPVVFMKGIIGRFFFQFGVAISVAVMLSLLEALTLTPMRCSQFLKTTRESLLGRWMDALMTLLTRGYRVLLAWCLDRRWRVIGAAVALFLLSLLLLPGLRKEFVPPQDQSNFMINLKTPLGSSLEHTDGIFGKAEAILAGRPEVKAFYSAVGGFRGGLVNQGTIIVTMKDSEDRPAVAPFAEPPRQQDFMRYIRGRIKRIPGLESVSLLDPSLSGFSASRGYPIQFSIQGPDWDKLAELSKKIMGEMEKSGMVTDVDSDYQMGMPEVTVVPDRAKAAARGVTVASIANTISATVGSLRVGKYTDDSGHRNDIRVKLLDRYSRRPGDIDRIMVRNIHGETVSLRDVVSITSGSSLLTITRYNRERAVTVFSNIAPGVSQSDIIVFIERAAARILPAGYHLVLSGSSQTFQESFQSLVFALILGIVVAYMVLGTQYNSFLHPLVILMALPFSATGAFIAMKLTGTSLNIYSMIGLLLLMGIVKKNAIMLVDFTNSRRAAGMGLREALMDACPVRLRPILMTSVATIAAAVPPAMSLGLGSETTRPMAIVVIGGVLLSTMLTLFVVPCAYSLLARFESQRHRRDLRAALESLGEVSEK
ncbi:MAG: efflux RND transporter permease subunit [Spirochaetes bacterium]|nr:efflux RND transporter permease subunit [Spirochaetota bacterium]